MTRSVVQDCGIVVHREECISFPVCQCPEYNKGGQSRYWTAQLEGSPGPSQFARGVESPRIAFCQETFPLVDRLSGLNCRSSSVSKSANGYDDGAIDVTQPKKRRAWTNSGEQNLLDPLAKSLRNIC